MTRGEAPRPMTAAELMTELERDPEHVARSTRREQQRQAAAGVDIEEMDDLYRRRFDHRRAIPILLRWLPQLPDHLLKETVVRALTVPLARPAAAPALVRELRDANADDDSTSGYRWAVGNALSVVADDTVGADLVELATDRRYGKSREMVVLALGNLTDPRVVDVLVTLLGDEDVAGHAVMALGKLRASSARAALEPFLDHHEAWVREEARKALASLDR